MVRGSDLVVTAVFEGREAAKGILGYLGWLSRVVAQRSPIKKPRLAAGLRNVLIIDVPVDRCQLLPEVDVI